MQIRALDLLRSRLIDPLTLVDVGARWGVVGRWEALGPQASVVGFDADPVECGRLNAMAPANVRYLPVGLADTDGPRTLYVTREPGCSSLFEPVGALVEHYPFLRGELAVQRTETIHCRRLDDVLVEEGIGPVTGLKLDTQGSELAILRGAERALATCAIVDVEVEFNPLYTGQNLFCDVDRFLRDYGFVLWRFENLVHYPSEVVPSAGSTMTIAAAPSPDSTVRVPGGQLFWAQAQYVRATFPRTGAESMTTEEALPAAVVAGLYGFWDLAVELVRKTGDVDLLAALRAELALSDERARLARKSSRSWHRRLRAKLGWPRRR